MSGGKRHLLDDTTGLLLRVVVHPANVQDRDGGRLVLAGMAARFPRLVHRWADTADPGPFAQWVTQTLGGSVTIVRNPGRWVWVAGGQEPPPYPVGSCPSRGGGWWGAPLGG